MNVSSKREIESETTGCGGYGPSISPTAAVIDSGREFPAWCFPGFDTGVSKDSLEPQGSEACFLLTGHEPTSRSETAIEDEFLLNLEPSFDDDDVIPMPDACETCGGLDIWISLAGTIRCVKCNPPLQAWKLRRDVERIRMREKMRRHLEGE